ncbi:MAG: hypothetical protein ABWJ42_02390 [Sulfolobales archaeon]
MIRVLVHPEYLRKLLSLMASDILRILTLEETSRREALERLDACIFLSERYAESIGRRGVLGGCGGRTLYLLERSLERGYKPLRSYEEIYEDGFLYDPEAFNITIDLLVEFLSDLKSDKQAYIAGAGHSLKRLYEHAIGKSSKILDRYWRRDIVALTPADYYILRASGVVPLDVVVITLSKNPSLRESYTRDFLRDKCIATTKQTLEEARRDSRFREIIEYLISRDLKLVIANTSLSCYHLAPVIMSVSLYYEC